MKFKHVFAFFFIFVTTSFFIPPFFKLLPGLKHLPPYEALGWIQALTLTLSILLLYLYAQTLPIQGMKKIWKKKGKESGPPLNDFIIGALCWFLTFPLITVLGQLIDSLVHTLFELPPYEQVAVRFLKLALGHPLLLVTALITIVIIAPFLEEFLFRGVLQSYLRKHLGRNTAITLSSLFFAFFHFAPSQKGGNISLIISLFAFACFLGFLYEKKKSLLAPIGLHMTFNLMGALRVFFITEGS